MKTSPQGGTMAARTRRELSREAVRMRINKGKMYLSVRTRKEYKDVRKWRAFVESMGDDVEVVRASMRIAKRFGDTPDLLDKLLDLDLPFNFIYDLSHPDIPDVVILQFLSQIRQKPSQVECTSLLKEINEGYQYVKHPLPDWEDMPLQDEVVAAPHPESVEEFSDDIALFRQSFEQLITVFCRMEQRLSKVS